MHLHAGYAETQLLHWLLPAGSLCLPWLLAIGGVHLLDHAEQPWHQKQGMKQCADIHGSCDWRRSMVLTFQEPVQRFKQHAQA